MSTLLERQFLETFEQREGIDRAWFIAERQFGYWLGQTATGEIREFRQESVVAYGSWHLWYVRNIFEVTDQSKVNQLILGIDPREPLDPVCTLEEPGALNMLNEEDQLLLIDSVLPGDYNKLAKLIVKASEGIDLDAPRNGGGGPKTIKVSPEYL